MDETDAAAAEAQSGENESDPDLALCPPASPVGNTFWCQWGECFARDRRWDRTASVVLIMSSAWRKFTQRRTTARRSTTVAVDLPLFAPIFLQLLVLDGVERLFGHDQAPFKCLPQQQVSGNLLFFATCASLPRRWIVHSPLFVFFYKFSQFRAAIEVAEQPPNKLRRNSSFLVNRWRFTPSFRSFDACRTCCSRKRNRRPFSASPSNSVDCVTHAIRSIVAPFKSHGTVNSRKGRHGEWTRSIKISRT